MDEDVKAMTDKLLTWLLTPLSWCYGAATSLRNRLYDRRILPSYEFDIPVISVGNITVGGTGKTPHVEYLVERLSPYYKIGVISRGYKRKTKGYIDANRLSTPDIIGDEPYQIYRKYGVRIHLAVCENRCKAITRITQDHPEINLIILDDAFQHRRVRPKVNIMLTDVTRPIYEDRLLPLGRLREAPHGMNRANIVVATKCSADMQPIDYRIVSNHLQLFPFQKLFFSHFRYLAPQPVFPDDCPYTVSLESLTSKDTVLLLTGIASPRSLVKYVDGFDCRVRVAGFPDHHDFSRSDLRSLENDFKRLKGKRKIILTTEKDAVRLMNNPYFPHSLKSYIFYQPVVVEMNPGIDDSDFLTELRAMIDRPNESTP